MAINNIGTNVVYSSNVAATSHSTSHTCTAGSDRIVVIGTQIASTSVTSVTYGGVTCTYQGGIPSATLFWFLYEEFLPSNGAQTVTVNCSSSSTCAFFVTQYENVHQTFKYSTYYVTATPKTTSLSDIPVGSLCLTYSYNSSFSTGSYTYTNLTSLLNWVFAPNGKAGSCSYKIATTESFTTTVAFTGITNVFTYVFLPVEEQQPSINTSSGWKKPIEMYCNISSGWKKIKKINLNSSSGWL